MTGDKVKELPELKKVAKSVLALLIVVGVGYFYWQEIARNQLDLDALSLSVSAAGYLVVALIFCLFSYLCDAIIWKMLIATRLAGQDIKFRELVAIIYTSGMFRYLPGRIWVMTAQAFWLGKYGIEKSFTLYINLVFMVELVLFSLYSGFFYLSMYMDEFSGVTLVIFFSSLIVGNVLFNCCSCSFLNAILDMFHKKSGNEIEPIQLSATGMTLIQLVFSLSWLLLGVAVFFLAKGFGLELFLADIFPVVFSMALSLLAGILTFVTPAGLGVREGVMLWMLKPVFALQTALLLPILTRLLMSITEGILGLLAYYLGVKKHAFALEKRIVR